MIGKPRAGSYDTLEDYWDDLEAYNDYMEYKYDEWKDDKLLEEYEKEQEDVRGNS